MGFASCLVASSGLTKHQDVLHLQLFVTPHNLPEGCNTALDNRKLANVTAACLGQCHFGRDPCLCRSAGGLTGGAANRERSTADDDFLGFNLRISASGRDSWFAASHSDDEDKAGSGLTWRETAPRRNATLTGCGHKLDGLLLHLARRHPTTG